MIVNSTVGTSVTDLFTCSNPTGSAVTSILFYNSHTAAIEITLYLCPAGEAEALENTVFVISIDPGETLPFEQKIFLSDTDVISAQADTGSLVSATVSYLNT